MTRKAPYRVFDPKNSGFRYNMPYHLKKIDHPTEKHAYLPLNRDYRPLGVTSDIDFDFQDYIDDAICFLQDPCTVTDVWSGAPSKCMMYNDNPNSRRDYYERLDKLYEHAK